MSELEFSHLAANVNSRKEKKKAKFAKEAKEVISQSLESTTDQLLKAVDPGSRGAIERLVVEVAKILHRINQNESQMAE